MNVQIGDVVGDYKVKGIAGAGGMGEVYRIEHIITRRVEAMKLLPPGLSNEPEQVQRFEREIQVQARLHHPNIVEVYNAVRDGDAVAMVMEFVDGKSLQRVLESGPLPLQKAIHYMRQVLSALAYAHESGVIHRDVAPANIIITPDGNAKLTDFGLARAETDPRLTSAGVAVGSPWYMSPEQVRGVGVIDHRTDIYAAGAVLHEMLTGRKLFDVDGAFSVMRAQVEATPPPPSSLNPAVPAALDEIVRKALAKDREERFASADEFRLAVESAVECPTPLVAPVRPRRPRTTPAQAAQRTREWVKAQWPVFRISRRDMLMGLAPGLLLAACYATWLAPKYVGGAPAPVRRPAAVAVPISAPPATAPALPEPAQPVAPPAALPVPAIMPPRPVVTPPRTPAAPVRAPQIAARPEPDHALRVSGAEVLPPAPQAATGPGAWRLRLRLSPRRRCPRLPWYRRPRLPRRSPPRRRLNRPSRRPAIASCARSERSTHSAGAGKTKAAKRRRPRRSAIELSLDLF